MIQHIPILIDYRATELRPIWQFRVLAMGRGATISQCASLMSGQLRFGFAYQSSLTVLRANNIVSSQEWR
jgi:hypothetical protein